MNNPLINYLAQFMTGNRVQLFDTVLEKRTQYLAVVLEDIYHTQNASAVVRTCDCFGIQDLHIIENRNRFKVNVNVALGATQWLSIHKYSGENAITRTSLMQLKQKGYRIVVTSPHAGDINLQDFDLAKGKAAFVFGTERQGVSPEAIACADEFLKIPMVGFTESFNISVSVAIILHHLTMKLHNSDIDWHLSPAEKETIKLLWMKNSIKRSDLLEKEFYKNA